MGKGNLMGKIFGIALACLMIGAMLGISETLLESPIC